MEFPPETEIENIGARNERQAMDWSLVLISQGIEVTPNRDPQTGRWCVQVPTVQSAAARKVINRFLEENRRFEWRKEIGASGMVVHWAGFAWPLVLGLFFAAQDRFEAGAIFKTAAFQRGEWWRPVTAMFLHTDLGHFAANATFGALTIGLAMGQLGVWPALFLTLLTGTLGNLFALAVRGHDYNGLGASGAVMGALGLAAAGSFHAMRQTRFARRPLLVIVGSAFLLFSLFGLDARADVLAHFGGFSSGLVLGWLALVTRLNRYHQASALLLLAFMGAAWFMALRQS